jgi:hypothetical protein
MFAIKPLWHFCILKLAPLRQCGQNGEKKVAARRPIGGEGTGVMYAFLLSLGAAVTAAGIALVASGVSLEDRAFDASGGMPGIIAIIGGCILVGLSFVVRALLRVEWALNARAAARAAPAGETSADTSADHAGAPRLAPPPQPKTAEASTGPVAAEQAPAHPLSEKPPAVERIESAPVVDAGDVSLLPRDPARSDEDHSAAQAGLANGKLNGMSHTTTAPRLAGGPGRRPQPKNSIFDTLWPKASSASADAQPAPTVQPAAAAASAQAAQVSAELAAPNAAHTAAASPSQAPAPVSILKSGVVEGMAYTLYSDGSIEAQLPGGTVRFASITELRSHIEQNG